MAEQEPKKVVAPEDDFSAHTDDAVLAGALTEMQAEHVPEPEPVAEPADAPVVERETPKAPDEIVVPEAPVEGEVAEEASVDPLDGTTPLSYLAANGASLPFDGIYEVPDGGGAIIPPDKLDRVKQVFAAADRAIVENQEWGAFKAQVEGLTYTSGDQEYTGIRAFHQLQADHARDNTSATEMVKEMLNPQFVTALGFAYQEGDQAQVKALLDGLAERAMFSGEKAQWTTLRSAETPRAQPQNEGQVLDQAFERELAKMVDWAKSLGTPLTATDVEAARNQFAPFKRGMYRDPTPEELQANPRFKGQKVFDTPMMHPWFTDRVALRKAETEREKSRTTADAASKTADKFNAGQTRGRQPTKPAKRPTNTPAPAPERVTRSQQWDTPLDQALAEMGMGK